MPYCNISSRIYDAAPLTLQLFQIRTLSSPILTCLLSVCLSQMSLKLDTSRNELLMANTTLTIATVAIGFSAYVTGVFGMNLDQTTTIQNVYGIFEAVFTVTFALIFVITGLIWYYYKRTGVLPSTIKLRHTADLQK
jgi:Mg2+ and Co2+ transporter CorA